MMKVKEMFDSLWDASNWEQFEALNCNKEVKSACRTWFETGYRLRASALDLILPSFMVGMSIGGLISLWI